MLGGPGFRVEKIARKFKMLSDYLNLRDYERADKETTARIIKRQSRGSIFAQNGWYITRKALDRKSREADAHIRNLRKAIEKAS